MQSSLQVSSALPSQAAGLEPHFDQDTKDLGVLDPRSFSWAGPYLFASI